MFNEQRPNFLFEKFQTSSRWEFRRGSAQSECLAHAEEEQAGKANCRTTAQTHQSASDGRAAVGILGIAAAVLVQQANRCQIVSLFIAWVGAVGGGRTHTLVREPDFESSASANSATTAQLITNYLRKFRPGHLTLCHMLCHCNAMQPDETPGNPGSPADPDLGKQLHRAVGYPKVRDARKRPVRGLWVLNGCLYARVPLPIPTPGPPRSAASHRKLPPRWLRPRPPASAAHPAGEPDPPAPHDALKFKDNFAEYLSHIADAKDEKLPSTMVTERAHRALRLGPKFRSPVQTNQTQSLTAS